MMQCVASNHGFQVMTHRFGAHSLASLAIAMLFVAVGNRDSTAAGPLLAGVAKVDITKREAGPISKIAI
jgi:hypothetical protein